MFTINNVNNIMIKKDVFMMNNRNNKNYTLMTKEELEKLKADKLKQHVKEVKKHGMKEKTVNIYKPFDISLKEGE